MEIKVIAEDETMLELEVAGEDHTFCNLLREALSRDPRVEVASYRIEHPLVSEPVVFLQVKEGVEVPREGEREVELTAVPGIGAKRKEQLEAAGIKSANMLLSANVKELAEKTGIPESILKKYVEEAKKLDYGIPSPPRFVLKQVLEGIKREFQELEGKLP